VSGLGPVCTPVERRGGHPSPRSHPNPVTALPLSQTALPIPTEFPPLPEVQLPAYTTHVLPNGLRVFLLEDHELGACAQPSVFAMSQCRRCAGTPCHLP